MSRPLGLGKVAKNGTLNGNGAFYSPQDVNRLGVLEWSINDDELIVLPYSVNDLVEMVKSGIEPKYIRKQGVYFSFHRLITLNTAPEDSNPYAIFSYAFDGMTMFYESDDGKSLIEGV